MPVATGLESLDGKVIDIVHDDACILQPHSRRELCQQLYLANWEEPARCEVNAIRQFSIRRARPAAALDQRVPAAIAIDPRQVWRECIEPCCILPIACPNVEG